MATYLVDYENRNQKGLYNGLSGVDKLEATDNVYVFLGSISKVPYHVLNACINESKASITFKKCEKSGDNYLDFQLGTLLGNLIASTDEKLYYIVTEDNDFLALSDFWARENIGVQIIKQPVVKFVPEMFQLGANTNSFVTGNTNGNSNGNNSNNSSNNNGNNNNSRRGRDNRPTSKKKPKLASEVHHHDAESATVATDIATDTVAIASQPNGNDIALVVDSSSNLDHSNNHGDNQSKKKNRSELLREIWANKNQNTEQVEVAAEPAVHNEAPSIDEPAIATIDASVSVEDVVATTPTAITLPKTRKKSTKKAKDNVAADSTVAVSNVATDSTVVSIATAPDPGQKVEYTSPPESIRKRIRPVIQAEGLNRGAFRTVYDLFAKSEKKLELNNSLIRAYKQEAGSRLYKSLVPIFNDYVKMR